MWKKALTPISVIVLLIGVGLIVYSTLGGDDSASDPTSSAVSLVDEAVPTASIAGDTSAPGGSTAPSESAAPSGTTVAPASPSTTSPSSSSSIFFPSFPSIVIPSTLGSPPSSFFVPSIPTFTLVPGVIELVTCNSFQTCAQKLYDAWKANNLGMATNFATPAAIATLNAKPYATVPGPWATSVLLTSPTQYIALRGVFSFPAAVRFNFVSGQSGFKVQSVQFT